MENYSEFFFHCKRDPIQSALGTEARTMIYSLVGQRKGNSGYCWPGKALRRERQLSYWNGEEESVGECQGENLSQKV